MRAISLLIIAALLLTGCGSGSDTGKDIGSLLITGTAARQAVIYLKDTAAKEITTDTDNNGNFTLNTTGLQKPFLLKAIYSNTSTHFAVADKSVGLVAVNAQSTSLLQLAAAGIDLLVLYATFKIGVFLLIVDAFNALLHS